MSQKAFLCLRKLSYVSKSTTYPQAKHNCLQPASINAQQSVTTANVHGYLDVLIHFLDTFICGWEA